MSLLRAQVMRFEHQEYHQLRAQKYDAALDASRSQGRSVYKPELKYRRITVLKCRGARDSSERTNTSNAKRCISICD